jgi:hypothetical protein
MSRNNKVNRDHYMIAGRLPQDEWARQRKKQTEPLWGTKRRKARPAPPWMAGEPAGAADDAVSTNEADEGEATQQPRGRTRREASGTPQGAGNDQTRTKRRTTEARPQDTKAGTTRGARPNAAKTRSTKKAPGRTASATGRGGAKSTKAAPAAKTARGAAAGARTTATTRSAKKAKSKKAKKAKTSGNARAAKKR